MRLEILEFLSVAWMFMFKMFYDSSVLIMYLDENGTVINSFVFQ